MGAMIIFWTISVLILKTESIENLKSKTSAPLSSSTAQESIKKAFLHGWEGYKKYA
jgi:hypothetical protein